jgi:cation transport protein ChaC
MESAAGPARRLSEMMDGRRRMRLSRELADLCHRKVAEPAPNPRYDYLTDNDYIRAVARLKAERPPGPFWLFAYGSLMWKPAFDVPEQKRAVARGWHRAFSMRIESHRGTPEQHGYMMCLDRGGPCEGLIQRIADDDIDAHLMTLFYREIGSDEAMESVRWIEASTDNGPVTALTFYAAPDRLDLYEAARPLNDIAHALARACGHWGSGAEYLLNTVSHLEELGVHDENLWALQEMVAAEIEAIYGRG